MANHRLLERIRISNTLWLFAPLFATLMLSFFLGAAAHRMVFYILCPVLIFGLFQMKDTALKIIKSPLMCFILIYFGYFFLSIIWSVDATPYGVFRLFVDIICIIIFVLGFATWLVNAPYQPPAVRQVVICSVGIIVAYAVLFYGVQAHAITARFEGFGRYVNPIHLSAMLAIALFSCVICVKEENSKRDWAISTVLVCVILLLIFLTQTRSTLMGLFAGVVAMIALRGYRVALVVFAIAGVCAFVVVVLWDGSLAALTARGDTYRLAIWAEAVDLIKLKPFIGHGILFDPQFLAKVGRGPYFATHNVILGHLIHGGLLGLTVFLGLILRCAYAALKALYITRNEAFSLKERALSCLAVTLICFSAAFSQFVFSHYIVGLHCQWFVFWVPVGLCLYLDAFVSTKSGKV